MPLDAVLLPAVSAALDSVDQAALIVRDVRARLGDLAARAGCVAIDADWRAPSARAFHEGLERWRVALLTAQGRADDVLDALARARAEIQARAWAEHP